MPENHLLRPLVALEGGRKPLLRVGMTAGAVLLMVVVAYTTVQQQGDSRPSGSALGEKVAATAAVPGMQPWMANLLKSAESDQHREENIDQKQELAGKKYIADEVERAAARKAAVKADDPTRQIRRAIEAKQAATQEAQMMAKTSEHAPAAPKTQATPQAQAKPVVQKAFLPAGEARKVEFQVQRALELADATTDALEAKLLMQTYAGKGAKAAAGLEKEVKQADSAKLHLIQSELTRIGTEMSSSLVARPASSKSRLQDPMTGPVDTVDQMKSDDKDEAKPLEKTFEEMDKKAAPTGDEGANDDDPFSGDSNPKPVTASSLPDTTAETKAAQTSLKTAPVVPKVAKVAKVVEVKKATLSTAAQERQYLRKYVAKIGKDRNQDSQLEKDAEQDEREDEQTADNLTGQIDKKSSSDDKSGSDDEDDGKSGSDSDDESEAKDGSSGEDTGGGAGKVAEKKAWARRGPPDVRARPADSGEKLVSLSKNIKSKADLDKIRAVLDKDFAKVSGEGDALEKFAQKNGLKANLRKQNVELEQAHP